MYHSILYALTRGLFFFFFESSTRGFDILSASLSFFSPDEYISLNLWMDSTVHPGATNCLTNPILDFLTEE